MEPAELRELTLLVLKDRHTLAKTGRPSDAQFRADLYAGTIVDQVAFSAYQAGIWKPPEPLSREEPQFVGAQFPEQFRSSVRGVLWQLVGLGILIPVRLASETGQSFELSAYGQEVVEGVSESPYDPSGSFKRLNADAPALAPETFEFVEEALKCPLARYLRSAAVMLGLASENELLGLIELCKNKAEAGDPLHTGLDQARSSNITDTYVTGH